MKPSVFYKIAAILLVLFAAGHTSGFRKLDPAWKVDDVVRSMQVVHFVAQGFDRTYYEFYVGFGLFVSVFLLFSAVIAWQLGAVRAETLSRLPGLKWGLVVCFALVTFLSWKYFFVAPVVFSALITLCLGLGACLPARQ